MPRALLMAGLILAAPALACAAPKAGAKASPEPAAWKSYSYPDVKVAFEAPHAPKVTHDGGSNDLSADYTVTDKAAILTVSAVDFAGVNPRPPIRDSADTVGLIYHSKPKVTPVDVPGATAVDWSFHAANGTDVIGRVIDAGRFEYRVSAVLTYDGAADPAAKAHLKADAERFIHSVSVTP
jgi:hypothetical protein